MCIHGAKNSFTIYGLTVVRRRPEALGILPGSVTVYGTLTDAGCLLLLVLLLRREGLRHGCSARF